MRRNGAALFPVALMALLAAATFWLDRATRGDGEARDGKRRHDPDYIVDNFHVRRFDVDGALQHSLDAQKMLHYPDDESTEVIAPRLTYHRTPPTHVTSRMARLDKDGKHVKLEGDVRVISEGSDNRPRTEIATSLLFVQPEDEVAHTDKPVTISQGHSVIHGTGLETSNKTHVSVLFGRVQGTIHPHQVAQTNSTQESSPHETTTFKRPTAVKPPRAASRPGRKGRQGQARQP